MIEYMGKSPTRIARFIFADEVQNDSNVPSDSASLGSNPSPPANFFNDLWNEVCGWMGFMSARGRICNP